MIRVAVFASGAGSNAINLLKTANGLEGLQIPLLIVDQQTSPLLERVPEEFPNTEVALITPPPMKDARSRREVHETEVLATLKAHSIDWCFLAGYMRLVGPTLLRAFRQENGISKIVNIHPSLLPKYPGLNAYEQAFQAGEKISGITIHFVDEGMDTGPVIQQKSFPREKRDELEKFIERGKQIEWTLYSEVLTRLSREGTLRPEKIKS